MMILQDNDPHHMHPDPYSVYYFLILAVILMAVMLCVGAKLMNFLDNRNERKQAAKNDAGTAAEDERADK